MVNNCVPELSGWFNIFVVINFSKVELIIIPL